jgi:hypothetical protein
LDIIAWRPKEEQHIPYHLEINFKLPQDFFQKMYDNNPIMPTTNDGWTEKSGVKLKCWPKAGIKNRKDWKWCSKGGTKNSLGIEHQHVNTILNLYSLNPLNNNWNITYKHFLPPIQGF